MAIINLRKIFPAYELDCFVEVPDEDMEAYVKSLTKEVADIYVAAQREENARHRQMYRYNAQYPLGFGDEIEWDALQQPDDLFEVLLSRLNKEQLHTALKRLPEKQLNRIHAFYFLGKSKSEIARDEGVDEKAVRLGIERGLATLKKS